MAKRKASDYMGGLSATEYNKKRNIGGAGAVDPVKAPTTTNKYADEIRNRNTGSSSGSSSTENTTPTPLKTPTQKTTEQKTTTTPPKPGTPESFLPGEPKDTTDTSSLYKDMPDLKVKEGTPTLDTSKVGEEGPSLDGVTKETDDERIGAEAQTEEQKAMDAQKQLEEEMLAKKNEIEALDQAETLEKYKKEQEYQELQRKLIEQQQQATEEQELVASSAKIRRANEQLGNLKRNLAYIGPAGMPGVSSEALEAVGKTLTEANTSYKEMVRYEKYAQEMRELGYEFDKNKYEKTMADLQDQLDSQVDQSIQKIFSQMTSDEIAGKLDTMEEVEELGKQYYDMLDQDISRLTRKQYDLMTLEYKRGEEYLQRVRDFAANKNVINKEMSAMKGYYVDGNGNQFIDSSTGLPIPMDKEPRTDAIIDKDNRIYHKPVIDENGNETFEQISLFDSSMKNVWDNSSIADVAKLVNSGQMDQDVALDLLKTDAQKEKFVNYLSKDPNEVDFSMPLSEQKSAMSGQIMSGNIDSIANQMEEGQKYDIGSRGECGAFYNDMIGKHQGTRMPNKYEEKLEYVDESITIGEKGMGVVTNYRGTNMEEYGHVGIIASDPYVKDGVAGYDVISANLHNDGKVSKDFIEESLIAYTGGFVPTQITPMLTQEEQSMAGMSPKEQDMVNMDPMRYYYRATAALPTRLRDNVKEMERLTQFAADMQAEGYTPFETADLFIGFDKNDYDDPDFVQALRGPTYKIENFDPIGLARKLDNGDIPGAIELVETNVMQNAESEQLEPIAIFAQDKGDSVINQIEDNLKKLGIVRGNWNKLRKKFVEDDNFQKIESDLVALINDWRVRSAGTEMTPQERAFLDPLIADTRDNPRNAIAKIESFQSLTFDNLNSVRYSNGLPKLLTKEQLMNFGGREPLYREGVNYNWVQDLEVDDNTEETKPKGRSDEDWEMYQMTR